MASLFDLSALRSLFPAAPAASGVTKAAFIPSPAVAQAVMAQAQGQIPPPGMDPGAGPPPGGAPPAGGMPPGGAEAPPGAMPPDAAPPSPDGGAGPAPLDPALLAAIEAAVQKGLAVQAGTPGAAGAPGATVAKPGASVKIDPMQFHQMAHDISVQKLIMRQMADAMGLQIPAGDLTTLQSAPPASAQTAAPPGGAPASGAASQPAAPPSQVATALPNLPPAAAKAAVDLSELAALRLRAGVAVPAGPSTPITRPRFDAARLARTLSGRG